MALVEEIKIAIGGISHNKLDEEIKAVALACKSDLRNGGVNVLIDTDPLLKQALKLYAENPQKAKDFLTRYTHMTAQTAVDSWKRLGEFLIVRYNDGAVKPVKDGKMVRPASGHNASVSRPGYSEDFLRNLVKETGDRYKSK